MKNVKIFNRLDCCSERLSGANVILIDNFGKYLETYQIENATGITELNISSASSSAYGTYEYATVSEAQLECNARSDCSGVTQESSYALRKESLLNGSLVTAEFAVGPLTRKVRIGLPRAEHLHLREVQVFDYNNVNMALGKTATQSSIWGSFPASLAVDGNLDNYFHTERNIGKYLISPANFPTIMYRCTELSTNSSPLFLL